MESLVFIIGAPGSGKGTLGKRLAWDYGMYHLSVGDHLRESSAGKQLDESQQDYLKRGALMPNDTIISLIQRKLDAEVAHGHRSFLVDGFPRVLSQAISFEQTVRRPNSVIVLQCSRKTAEERFLTRNGRPHTSEDMFNRRFNEFENKQPPIVKRYQDLGIVCEIDSSTETEVTYGNLLAALHWKPDGNIEKSGMGICE